MLFFLERCVPQAERDVHFVRDVSFGSDVCFAREQGTHHITLRPTGAKHHYGEAITSLRRKPMLHSKLPPRVLKNTEKCAIIKSKRRWGYDKTRDNEKSYFVKCCFEAS